MKWYERIFNINIELNKRAFDWGTTNKTKIKNFFDYSVFFLDTIMLIGGIIFVFFILISICIELIKEKRISYIVLILVLIQIEYFSIQSLKEKLENRNFIKVKVKRK